MKWNTEIDLDRHKVFFTADLHFYHDNILWLNKRPFENCNEMYEYFKTIWNNKVGPDDYVFVLGDFCWGSHSPQLKTIAKELNGRICVVLGNHDKEKTADGKTGSNFDCFYSYSRADFIRCKSKSNGIDQLIYLSHYPTLSWPKKGRGSLMLHGHVHGSMDKYNEESQDLRVDVGVDAKLGYMNILSFDEIYEYMLRKAGGVSLEQYMENLYNKEEVIV